MWLVLAAGYYSYIPKEREKETSKSSLPTNTRSDSRKKQLQAISGGNSKDSYSGVLANSLEDLAVMSSRKQSPGPERKH